MQVKSVLNSEAEAINDLMTSRDFSQTYESKLWVNLSSEKSNSTVLRKFLTLANTLA